CICINCKWVDKCGAYHFVEEKKPKTAADTKPPFEPRDGSPTIEVNIRRIPVDDEEKATTVEYDVVACADFVPEQDRWINNMPEEIKLKNPDFVPT
ncbi:hypothetical protein TL16_g02400, partial [Triparma laevis f. inornata]